MFLVVGKFEVIHVFLNGKSMIYVYDCAYQKNIEVLNKLSLGNWEVFLLSFTD